MKEDKTNPNYEVFMQWFRSNGGRAKKLVFPSFFGPTEYVGMKAAETIKPNQVIIAIPKKLIIGVTLVRQSQLGKILQKYRILNDIDNEQTDFHILALYLIWQKQLGKQSFFYPYLSCIGTAQTILNWSQSDVQKLKDPTITPEFIEYIRLDFPEVFQTFAEISVIHTQLFRQVITWESFMQSYSIVMTRCFGWGLPETMMVPFADFLNHSCSGVNHYIFNQRLEEKDDEQYIKKSQELDLSLLKIDNKKKLPTSYARNPRQNFVHKNRQILKKSKVQYLQDVRLNHNLTRSYLDTINQQLLHKNYNVPLFPSTDSQDNDSQGDDAYGQAYKQRVFISHINKLVQKQLQPAFQQPKPYVNRQFLDGVDFSWWNQKFQDESYFIVSSSLQIDKNQQVYNSYGRRSNRFLLVWYGFTLFNNKYDSIPFRILSDEIYQKTGRLVYLQHLIAPQLIIGDQKYGYQSISEEYRLKKRRVSYNLMAYLRRTVIKKSEIYRDIYAKKLLNLHEIKNLELEKSMLQLYQTVLKHLFQAFDPEGQRQKIQPQYRNYFAHLLLKSNRDILEKHIKSIKILKKLITNLENGMTLNQAYHYKYQEEESDISIKITNRKHILDYFKMLSKYKNNKEITNPKEKMLTK